MKVSSEVASRLRSDTDRAFHDDSVQRGLVAKAALERFDRRKAAGDPDLILPKVVDSVV